MMATCNPTLLTGPYDWDPTKTSAAEFQTRLARALALAAGQGAQTLLVHGDRAEFGALAWLTAFVPKLGPALAIFPVTGGASLLFSGGPGMVGSAKRLTWIEELRALGAPARDFADLAGQRVAVWGEAAMTAKLHVALAGMVGQLIPADALLDGLRETKSESELALLEQASVILATVAENLLAALRDAALVGQAILSAERVGYRAGAQDVRILLSRRPGGQPLPVDDRYNEVAALPVVAQIAVRYGLHWADGVFPTAAA